jgi:tetratricopeptide (TPR) repeat protein
MNEIKARYFSSMAAEIERHGGSVEKNIGDAIMAVFGRIRAREDDALRAVRAAQGMHDALERLNEELLRFYGVTLKNRTGVNTGELVVNTDPTASQNLATGEAVNVAARLEQNAPANETLIGEVTYELVRPWVDVERMELQLKGYTEPVPAYRLITVHEQASERTEVEETPLVGRDAELARLQEALAEAKGERRARLVTVIGDAGVGKSRLIRDFLMGVQGETTILRGRCLPYGDGITFWPLGEVARAAAAVEQDDSPADAVAKLGERIGSQGDGPAITERLASAIGLSTARFPVAELLWAGRRFLEVLAADRPVAVLIDDIHWAEKTFLDLLDHVIDASKGAPILLLCSARHQLLERYADWGERPQMGRIMLEPLGDAFAAELVERLLGESGLDPAVSERVVKAADGNPLFVEQMVSMLIDKKLLRREGGHWIRAGDLSELAVPPSIQALLVSRLDDLTREERAVVEPASVIGLTFFEPAVAEMVPDGLRPAVRDHLEELDSKQFVQPAGDEETFRFRHIMIRDATYGSLLKRNRALLHERFVTWAERVNRERGREQEFEEILGYHLEQAFRYRTELGPLDEAGRQIARRAATKLGNAGQRAVARGDVPAGMNLLRRATALLDPDDLERIKLQVELAECSIEGGDFDYSNQVIEEAGDAAIRVGAEQLELRARLVRIWHGIFTGSGEVGAAAEAAEAERIARRFEALGDAAGAARAWRLLLVVQGMAGHYPKAAEAARRTVEAARAAGDGRIAARGAIGYASASMYGPTPSTEAMPECEQLLTEVRGDRKAESTILGVLAVLHAMQRDFTTARSMAARGRALVRELGPSVTGSTTSTELSRVDILAGDLDAAEAALRSDAEELEAIGERFYRSTVVGLLSRVLAERGADDEAARFAAQSTELADPDDTLSQVLARRTQAILAARAGDAENARRLADEAVSIASETEDIVLLADAQLDLAEVIATIGAGESPGPPLREALRLYEEKGDLVSADRVRARMGATAAA